LRRTRIGLWMKFGKPRALESIVPAVADGYQNCDERRERQQARAKLRPEPRRIGF
jgi:hypothetical protein